MLRTSALSLVILLGLLSNTYSVLGQALSAITSQTNVSCNGESNGTASVLVSGGTAPYTYSWSPSVGTGADVEDLEAGAYTCTVTDATAASIVANIIITEPVALSTTFTQIDASCVGNDGSATVVVSGGTAPYTYDWYPYGGTDATATGLIPFGYVCSIEDANGCRTREKPLIAEIEPMSTSYTHSDVSCNGGSDGSATVVVSGGTAPYTYEWFPSGGTDATANGLSAIGYTCNITDANGCVTSEKPMISEPDALVTSSTHTDVSCNGGANGTATVTASGGSGTYTYEWFPSGGTNATATGLTAMVYTCIITDGNDCIASQNPLIAEPDALSASVTKTDVSTTGGSDGTATVVVTGGTASYTYSWSPSGGTDATATGLSAGDYTVLITDNNNCTTSELITIEEELEAPDQVNAEPIDEEEESSVSLFPMPASESITVTNAPIGSTLKILSMDGSVMSSTTGSTVINISYLPSGIYTLVVESEEGTEFKKIIKE